MVEVDITVPYRYTNDDLIRAVNAILPKTEGQILDIFPTKRTLFVTEGDFLYKMTVAVSLPEAVEVGVLKKKNTVKKYDAFDFSVPKIAPKKPPLVVGLGPAGLFCALALAEAGANPIVIERGLDVEKRKTAVREYYLTGKLDPDSNIQFGEGGAGAFSDGKLKAGKNDPYKLKVLREFVASGAPEEILYETSAHLGTDKLPAIVKSLREKIISLGGTVRFSTKLIEILTKDGKVTGALVQTDGKEFVIDTDTVFLCTGHSAHDVFRLLEKMSVPMSAKPFGIGVRIEHPRELVNEWKYGKNAPSDLPTASYHLVTHLKNGRSAYSFCMCPGGEVVAAATEDDAVVTNGMSEFSRMGKNSNSALLVGVTPDDFGASLLGGFDLQRKIEKSAFLKAGASGKAPAQRLEDFMNRQNSKAFGAVLPTYPRGTEFCPVDEYMPDYICDTLRMAVLDFDSWMPGFYYPDAVLTGAETRSTSPVRIERNPDSFVAVSLAGLYPVGEGAGYSGGIVTSAMDGLKSAEAYINTKK